MHRKRRKNSRELATLTINRPLRLRRIRQGRRTRRDCRRIFRSFPAPLNMQRHISFAFRRRPTYEFQDGNFCNAEIALTSRSTTNSAVGQLTIRLGVTSESPSNNLAPLFAKQNGGQGGARKDARDIVFYGISVLFHLMGCERVGGYFFAGFLKT